MTSTFRLPSFSLTVQVALAHARIVARLGDFRRAVAILTERGGILLDSAIAIAARFFASRRVAA